MALVIGTCIALLRLVPSVVLLALASELPASELDQDLDWFIDPGQVILVNAGEEVRPEVRLSSRNGPLPTGLRLHANPLKLQGEEHWAWIGFEPDDKSWVEIDPAKDEPVVSVKFGVRGLSRPGLYHGDIIARTPDGRQSSSLALTLWRPALPRFEPALQGQGTGEDGAVSLVLQDTARQTFQLVVQRPDEIAQRILQFDFVAAGVSDEASAESGGMLAAISGALASPRDPQVVFEPNPLSTNDHVLKLTVKDVPERGLDGFIRISDAEDDRFARYVPALFTPARVTLSQTHLILFVIAGAVLSVLLNTALPAGISKRRKHDRIMDLRQKIQQSTTPGTWLHIALNVEQNRIRRINGDIQWFSASKRERFEELDQLIESLSENVAVAVDISAARKSLKHREMIPSRLRRAIDEHLDDAERALLDEQPVLARAHLQSATEIKDRSEEEILQELRERLPADITRVVTDLQTDPAVSQDPFLSTLLGRLQRATSGPDTREELLELERDYDRAALYRKFKREVLEQYQETPELNSQRQRFVQLLRAADFKQVVVLLSVLGRGWAPRAVYDALDHALPTITVQPASPEERQSATYTVSFPGEPGLNAEPVHGLLSFDWSFGDSTATCTGPRCVHHFPRTRPWPAPWGQPMLWLRRVLSGSYGRTVTVQITMADPSGSGERKVIPAVQLVMVRGSTGRGFGLGALEFMTFALSTAIAVLAALGAEYANLVGEQTWSAWLTAVLFGFGLDQIRDRSLNPAPA